MPNKIILASKSKVRKQILDQNLKGKSGTDAYFEIGKHMMNVFRSLSKFDILKQAADDFIGKEYTRTINNHKYKITPNFLKTAVNSINAAPELKNIKNITSSNWFYSFDKKNEII